jgi:uncharacterized protein YcaQ
MPPALDVAADHARRFLVRRHLLDPPRSLPAEPESVLRVIDRLGSLQFDPLDVPGARNHDLALHGRISGYRREWCERWLYGPGERRLIEIYNKSLNILPLSELPHYRIAWERSTNYYIGRILREQSAVAEAVLERISRDGALTKSAFRDHSHPIEWWWAPTSTARAVMEALCVSGRLGISRRDGNRRYYDLIERIVPADLLERRLPEEEQLRHRLLSRHRGLGLMAVGGPSELISGTGSAADRARITAALVEDGTLVPVAVDGLREARYVLGAELPILSATAPALSARSTAVTFMAPLDPLLWDRRLTRSLFGFEYIWEVYTPQHRRRHGYYVLPILFGERLIGRIEPRYDRKDRVLRVLGVWFETGFEPMAEPGFVLALAEALAAYRGLIGAKRVTWPRTRPGRDLAGAVRRLAVS